MKLQVWHAVDKIKELITNLSKTYEAAVTMNTWGNKPCHYQKKKQNENALSDLHKQHIRISGESTAA